VVGTEVDSVHETTPTAAATIKNQRIRHLPSHMNVAQAIKVHHIEPDSVDFPWDGCTRCSNGSTARSRANLLGLWTCALPVNVDMGALRRSQHQEGKERGCSTARLRPRRPPLQWQVR